MFKKSYLLLIVCSFSDLRLLIVALFFFREKVMAVEPCVANCLEVLSRDFSVKTKVQSQHGASKVEQQVLYAFPSGHVNQFLLSLRRVLSIGGLQRFLTPELKVVSL